MATYDYIYLNEEALPKPTNFTPAREDVYAGEYTTCTGKMIADRIGWKFSEIDLQWDALTDAMLQALISLEGSFPISFEDSDGQHTEQVIRRGFANTPTRITGPNGTKIWTGLEMEISFLNTHPIGE